MSHESWDTNFLVNMIYKFVFELRNQGSSFFSTFLINFSLNLNVILTEPNPPRNLRLMFVGVTSIELGWEHPQNTVYDGFMVNYRPLPTGRFTSRGLPRDAESYEVCNISVIHMLNVMNFLCLPQPVGDVLFLVPSSSSSSVGFL